MSTRDFSWGKGNWYLRLTTYQPRSVERQENPGPTRNPLGHFGLLWVTFIITPEMLLQWGILLPDKQLLLGSEARSQWCASAFNTPTANLDTSTSNLQNVIDKRADQPAIKRATPNRLHVLPQLNRRGWKQLIFKNIFICKMFVQCSKLIT